MNKIRTNDYLKAQVAKTEIELLDESLTSRIEELETELRERVKVLEGLVVKLIDHNNTDIVLTRTEDLALWEIRREHRK
jgi:hypothetical protein